MPNRLADSPSLYLRKHADNPIAWWPWCEAAIATARTQDKPIFLSIGYSSCHWCTVMEGEAFSDGTIAEFMNDQFLPIKVDREERPDLDSIYMQALQMMVGQGGWPLNIFLTPELVPFYGGTYFPVEPRYGRPGFLQVLHALRRFYDQDKEKLAGVTGEIITALQSTSVLQPMQDLNAAILNAGLDYSTGILLSAGPGPRFPMIPYADAVLHNWRFIQPDSQYDSRTASTDRGVNLALGGIFDHVAGGFHRYTVDPTWTVPHFEKMLYDNGQIMEYLANLWATGETEPAFERSIAETVTWLKREMTDPVGWFYAAQDADNFQNADDPEPEEGAFYVWNYAALQSQFTPEELQILSQHFTVTPSGNFEGNNVLQRYHPGALPDAIAPLLDRLFTLRYGTSAIATPTFPPARSNQEAKSQPWPGRIPPVTDPKMIVAWNGLMISGLARAASVFQRLDYFTIAAQAAEAILAHQWVDRRLHRVNYDGQPSVMAQSEDYALLIKALLDLHQAALALDQPEHSWLASAIRVQVELDEFLWSVELGGYFNTDARSDLLVRERNYMDHATPSANGIAIANLVRLGLLTDQIAYRDRAEQALQAFGRVMQQSPQACPSLFAALDWFLHGTIVKTSPAQIAQLARHYWPTTLVQRESNLPPGAIALVCEIGRCREPATTSEQLWEQLSQH